MQQSHAERPKDAPTPKVFFSDTTPESLVHKLATGWPSAILQSSEASIILAGHAAKNLGFLNTLWDGSEIEVDRRNGESFVVRDAQLSASLMVQPGVIQRFISKNNGMARDVGFLARSLICAPVSTQGTRFTTGLEPESTKNLDKFTEMTRQILRDYYSDEGVLCSEQIVLEFSPEGVNFWRNFYNWLESRLGPSGYYSDIADFASKIGENIARLAAIFHVMDGKKGNVIDKTTVVQAINIAGWYLDEFKRLLGEPQQLSEEFTNARLLERWLNEKCTKRQSLNIPKNYVRTHGPNHIRKKLVLDGALSQLTSEGKLQMAIYNKTQIVCLNPQFFGIRQRGYLEPDPNPLLENTTYI